MRDRDRAMPWQLQLGIAHVDEKPSVLALYRDSGTAGTGDGAGGNVVAWAVALPDGAAVVVPLDAADNRPILTTVRGLRRRWAPLLGATLVRVSGREVLHRAA